MEQNPFEQIFQTLSFINSPQLQENFVMLKFVLGSVGLFFLFFLVFALLKSTWLRYMFLWDAREFFTYRPLGLRRMTKRFQQSMARLETANEAEYKLAIIDSDAMLDEGLKRLGFAGENMDERLRILTSLILSNLEDVKRAHTIRNSIVHDPNFILSLDQAREMMAIYEKAFRDLDMI